VASTPPPNSGSISDPIIAALVNILQSGTNPQILNLQTALLRRLLLEGNVVPSRIPAPKNITEVGGYINLLALLGETDVQTELLASALGVASPQTSALVNASSATNLVANNPPDPPSTSSTTLQMAGLGVVYTPTSTGCLKVNVQATIYNDTAGDGAEFQISYGTGAAPSNSDSLTGTQTGLVAQSISPTNNYQYTVSRSALLTGLTVGVQYWFDLAYAAITGGDASFVNISITIEELQ
jgi:hypothetical protein